MTDRELLTMALEALETLARYENPKTKIQVRKPKDGGPILTMYPHKVASDAAQSLRQAIEQAEKQEPLKLWLWKNFVDGKPEYWAFDNPFPCMSVEGDPLTLGEPCGWAFLKPSVNGRPHHSEQEVINTVTRLASTPQPQRKWVGLTDEEMRELEKQFEAERVRTSDEEYLVIYPAAYWQWQRAIEAKLKEKNT